MEPRIQYAKTSDGVNIAYYAIGQGPALVFVRGFISNLLAEWRYPEFRSTYDAIARVSTLVRYDHRGFGLSDRQVDNFAFEAMVRDLEAVVDRLGLPHFSVFGLGFGAGQIAAAYAAHHPKRVRRLVVFPGVARVPMQIIRWTETIASIGEEDWKLATESLQLGIFGWDEVEISRAGAAVMREAVTLETLKRYLEALKAWDVSGLIAQITMPTLVVGEDWEIRNIGVSALKDFVASLPNGQLMLVDGASEQERWNKIANGVAAFLSEGRVQGFRITSPEEERPEIESIASTVSAYPAGLTARETEVLRLIAAGRTNREIAADLVLSLRTVARHITNIYSKIGARGKADATTYAIRHNLTQD